MRIGILPELTGSQGGQYQYSLTMLRALHEWKSQGSEDELVVFAEEMNHPAVASFNGQDWSVKPLAPVQSPSMRQKALDALQRVVGEGPLREAWRRMRRHMQGERGRLKPQESPLNPDVVRFSPEMNRWFHRCGIELMLYPAHTSLSFEARVPYVMAIHDLQHRLQPEFPEVSAHGEWELREYYLRNGTRHATLLLADSEVGREDILNFYGPYGVTPDRVKVLPYLPASHLSVAVIESERRRVRTTYGLPERYLFYPAQFWPHKNHARVVQALGLLNEERRLGVPIAFSGAYSDDIRERTFHEVMSVASNLGLENQVRYLGYVPDQDMSALYAGAVALVMPTFFGPTNIPVLEAWAFGCPVLTSDIRGIRDQTGNAAILVDPRSVEAIADGIYRLWTDENLSRTLVERGRQRLAKYTPANYRKRLIDIVEEAKTRLGTERPRKVP